jgi:hypothetical protein
MSKKADGADKLSPGSTPCQRPSGKPPSVNKPVAPKPSAIDLKYYNYNELGHISRDYLKPRIEQTKQVLIAKLIVVSTSTDTEGMEQGNNSP